MFEVTSAWKSAFPEATRSVDDARWVNPVHHPELGPFDLLLENIPQLKVREGDIQV